MIDTDRYYIELHAEAEANLIADAQLLLAEVEHLRKVIANAIVDLETTDCHEQTRWNLAMVLRQTIPPRLIEEARVIAG